jgi:hypothetical protein
VDINLLGIEWSSDVLSTTLFVLRNKPGSHRLEGGGHQEAVVLGTKPEKGTAWEKQGRKVCLLRGAVAA